MYNKQVKDKRGMMSDFIQDIHELDQEQQIFENDGFSDEERMLIGYQEYSLSEQLSYPQDYTQPHSQPFKTYLHQKHTTNFEIQPNTNQSQIFARVLPPQPEHKLTDATRQRKKALSLGNRRRKLSQRKPLWKLFKKSKQHNQNNRTGDQWTKNLLKVAKCSLANFLRESPQGQILIAHNQWLANLLRQKTTFNLEDFDLLYKNDGLFEILSEYFRKRILYRDLMISRVNEENKRRYMYYLDVFEENFRNREFLGISAPKQRIDERKRGNK